MAIDGGNSALANDFNSNLHEHFKVARSENMIPKEKYTNEHGDGGESRTQVKFEHPTRNVSSLLNHDPKSGHVESGPYVERKRDSPDHFQSSDPQDVKHQFKDVKKNSNARVSGGKVNYPTDY